MAKNTNSSLEINDLSVWEGLNNTQTDTIEGGLDVIVTKDIDPNIDLTNITLIDPNVNYFGDPYPDLNFCCGWNGMNAFAVSASTPACS